MDIFEKLTIGVYVERDSFVHRLDPRTKIITILLLSISIFLFKNLQAYVVLGLFLFAIILLSRLPFKFVIQGLRPLSWIIIFTFILHMFFTRGTPVLEIGPIVITEQGLYMAVFITLRLIFLILAASLLTLTTSPQKLTLGLERLLYPLKLVGISSRKIALMMTMALRFVPVLFQEAQRIINVQKSRGGSFSRGGPVKRMGNIIAVLIPLLSGVFRRADEISLAMEARGFDVDKPGTHLKGIKFSYMDFAAIIITAGIVGVIVLI